MGRILTSKPVLFLVIIVAAYSAYWFYMANKMEQEIYAWVEDQAEDGTEVTFENLQVSGYPLYFAASMDNPDIFVREGDRHPHWHGQKLEIGIYAIYLKHVDIHFLGTQTIVIEEYVGPMARPPAVQRLTFNGRSINMALDLTQGRVHQAKARFREVTMDIEDIGDYRPGRLKDLPTSFTIRLADINSRVRIPRFDEIGSIAHDYSVDIRDITSDRGAPNGLAKEISWIGFDLTESGDEDIAFHNGSLRIDRDRPRTSDKATMVRKAGIEWEPVSMLLSGQLKTPEGGKANGSIDLEIAGHKELVRVLAEQGDITPLAAILTGALVGVIEIMSLTDDNGTLHIPLDVRDGNVSFSFLPLTSLEELQDAAGLN